MHHEKACYADVLFTLFLMCGRSLAQDPPVETKLVLGAPQVAQQGPSWIVTVTGTASLSKDEMGFVGTQAELTEKLGFGTKYSALVNLPDGPPAPGKAGKPVVYTWTLNQKDTYLGTATMTYKDKNGDFKSDKANIDEFTIK
jgi:hypothetical protein